MTQQQQQKCFSLCQLPIEENGTQTWRLLNLGHISLRGEGRVRVSWTAEQKKRIPSITEPTFPHW